MAIFLFPVYPQTESLSESEKDNIKTGLELGKGIAELFENKEFTKSLIEISKSVGPYLGVIGPFVGLVMNFIPSESEELAFMKNMMKQIDNRFDRLDSRFNEVERLINWNAVKVNFGQIEQKILAMSKELHFIYEISKSGVKNRKTIFVNHYNSDFQNSGTKLYNALINTRGTFQVNLGTSVMRYTKNDRKLTQGFLLGIMKLLLQAAKIELAYYQMQGFVHNVVFMRKKWEKRIKAVKSNFEAIDRSVKYKYHVQAGIDTTELAVKKKWMSNKRFAKALYKMLAKKFYWREWIVLIYNEIWGWKNHCVSACGGHVKFRTQGRNIVIASRDQNHSVMDLRRAERDMNNVAVTYRAHHWPGKNYNKRRRADNIYSDLNKSGACNVAVIKWGSGLHYYAYSRRFKSVSRSPYFKLNMWG
jgi:hypothetical protein